MRKALDQWEGGIGIGGRVVTNLRNADLYIYKVILKTKVMTTGDIGEVKGKGSF